MSTNSVRKGPGPASNVPPEILDKAVLKIMEHVGHGVFERYTRAEIKLVRDLLGEEYVKEPLSRLRNQMINRRKGSIYAKPAKRQAAARWKKAKAAIKAYWAGESTLGALVDRVADEATRRAPKERRARRQRSLRRDSSVGRAEREIERVFGLPPGCVRLVNPDRHKARADKLVGALLKDWGW